MRAGRLRTLLTIEQPVAGGRNPFGEKAATWTLVAQEWAEIRVMRGDEALRMGVQRATRQVRIRIRARTDLTTVMRATAAGREYAFEAIHLDDSGVRTEILAEERLSP